MAESNVELHRRASDLWNEGDWDAVYSMYDDEIVFEDGVFPDAGTYSGRDEVIAHLEELRELGGTWKFDTEALLELGEDVVWIGRSFGQANEDTPPYESRNGGIFTYVDGRLRRMRWFATVEETLAAAGLPADAAG